jgi:hypothetical protein
MTMSHFGKWSKFIILKLKGRLLPGKFTFEIILSFNNAEQIEKY